MGSATENTPKSRRNGSTIIHNNSKKWPFWEVFVSSIFAAILLRHYQYSIIAITHHFARLREEYTLGGVGSAESAYSVEQPPSSAVNSITKTTTAASDVTTPTQLPPSMISPQENKHTMGERWIKEVQKWLEEEEDARKMEKGSHWLRKRLAEVNASAIDDPQYWHAVTQEDYQETLNKARASMDDMIEQVYTDCLLWLVPPKRPTAMEVELDDWANKLRKNNKPGPVLRFQCGNEDQISTSWQETPCRSANLCLVRSDPLQWKRYYHVNDGDNFDTNNGTNATTVSHYNHVELEHRFSPPKRMDESDTLGRKSAILTMVDSLDYLLSGKPTKRCRSRPCYHIWECFLNKASYAFRTNRDLYLWIGGFQGDNPGDEATSILHQRNTDVLSRTFGADCKPESPKKNVVHYYKPIAFGALFRKLRSREQSKGAKTKSEQRVWFVDADIFFNSEAYSPASSNSDNFADEKNTIMSLDDYFDISPQASLLGSQNPSAKNENILINGGLIGLRSGGSSNSISVASHGDNGLDDWVLNFSALWWYCRCGERDQIALWLVLFATWSAKSSNGKSSINPSKNLPGNNNEDNPQFAYPRVAFENYLFSWVAVIPHAWAFLPSLQRTWSQKTAAAAVADSLSPVIATTSWTTTPTNTSLYNGGQRFLNSTHGGMYSYPMELPHVLLLPLDPFVLPTPVATTTSELRDPSSPPPPRSDFYLSMVRKNQKDKKALLTHDKNRDDFCYEFRCWPFLIREDPLTLQSFRKMQKQKRHSSKLSKDA